jgi:aminopeptidase YwaD
VPGAADNLSACATVLATCRFLLENPAFIPQDTEIRFISFGSEEAGLRGSRRYVERHLDELKHLDVRVLNYEVIAIPRSVF